MVIAGILFFCGIITRQTVELARQDKVAELRAMGGSAIEAIQHCRFSTFEANLMLSLSFVCGGVAIMVLGSGLALGLLVTLAGVGFTTLCFVYRERLYI
jgi:hypothetical protein